MESFHTVTDGAGGGKRAIRQVIRGTGVGLEGRLQVREVGQSLVSLFQPPGLDAEANEHIQKGTKVCFCKYGVLLWVSS